MPWTDREVSCSSSFPWTDLPRISNVHPVLGKYGCEGVGGGRRIRSLVYYIVCFDAEVRDVVTRGHLDDSDPLTHLYSTLLRHMGGINLVDFLSREIVFYVLV